MEFRRFGLRVGGGCDGGGGGKEPSASEGERHRAGGPAPRSSLLLGVTPSLKVPLWPPDGAGGGENPNALCLKALKF